MIDIPRPIDPAFLESQIAFKKLSDEMLAHKPNPHLSDFSFKVSADPASTLERLSRSSLSDMLLQPGDSLCVSQPDSHYEDLGLIVGETPLLKVVISHGDWTYPKTRQILIDPPQIPPYRVVEYPGETDWHRQIGIQFWYGTEHGNKAFQSLLIYDSSDSAGKLPLLTRFLYSPQYAETGYEGHEHSHRPLRDQEEAMNFINLARELAFPGVS